MRDAGPSDPSIVHASRQIDAHEQGLRFLELLEPLRDEMSEIEPGIKKQLDNYLEAIVKLHQDTYEQAGEAEAKKKLAGLYFKLWQFFYSREERLKDIQSPEIREIIELKRSLFPLDLPKWVLCIDGRIITKLTMGLHGNSIKTPAGDLPEVVPNRDANQPDYLDEGEFSSLLDGVFENVDVINEVYDSHVACAAGGKEIVKKEALTGSPEDAGLMAEVKRKKVIQAAIEDYVMQKYHGKKRVASVQTSFDPHTGFMYMGLEKNECLEDENVKKHGYSHEILHNLAEEGKILSTESFLEEDSGDLMHLFEKHHFDIDYRSNYKESTILFWTRLKEMADDGKATRIIRDKILRIFPGVYGKEKQGELKQRVMIVLANTYSGYLHNFNKDGSRKKYPYSDHDESVIAVTSRENGPFDRARGFNVFPDSPTLSTDVDLAHGIVQGVRRSEKFSKSEAKLLATLYPAKGIVEQDLFEGVPKVDAEAYVNNPVAVLAFERLKKMPSPEVVKKLQETNWGEELQKIDWLKMESEKFFDFLNEVVPEIPSVIAHRINVLRKKAIGLYKRGEPATAALLDGRLAPIWTLCGPERETLAMIPFVTRGY